MKPSPVIQANYVDGRKLDYNSVFKSSITGMLKVLDPHSTYFDPIDFAAFKTEQRSEYFGIGATIDHMQQGDQINTFIRATFDDSPAARAGSALWRSHSRSRRPIDGEQELPRSA